MLFRGLQAIGITVWVLGGILMLGWYIEWLDDYFVSRLAANGLGLLTFPLIPLAVLVEWVWHGWPSDVTVFFLLSFGGIGLYALGSFIGTARTGSPRQAARRNVSSGSPGRASESTEFAVVLVSVDKKDIHVLKEIRAITGMDLKEVRNLVDGGPFPIKEGISKSEAETIKKRLHAHGATVEVSRRN